MLKRIAILVVALLPPLVIVAMILGARSLWVPIPKDRYEDCFNAAKQTGNKHPDCRLYETIWERGFVDPTAYYTLWLTLFTGALAAVGIAGIGFTLWQIKRSREEFNAVYRPQITVRSVIQREHVVDGRPRIAASVACFNRGQMGAANVTVRGRITRTHAPSAQTYWDEIKTRSSRVARGLGHQFTMESDYPMDEEGFNQTFADDSGPHIYCVGTIYYDNPSGEKVGMTGFCRVWKNDKWCKTNMPELEYEL